MIKIILQLDTLVNEKDINPHHLVTFKFHLSTFSVKLYVLCGKDKLSISLYSVFSKINVFHSIFICGLSMQCIFCIISF